MKLVFLHGLGQTATSWDAVQQRLSMDSENIVALELFDSFSANDTITLNMLDDVVSAKIANIQEPFVLCGLSLGAILTLKQATRTTPFLKGIIVSAAQFETPNRVLLAFQNTIFRLLPNTSFLQFGLSKKQTLQLMGSLSTLNMREEITKIALPTLILCGEKDHPNLPAAKKLRSIIPHSTLQIIADGKHELNIEQPIPFAILIDSFLKSLA
ncbi:alpha/beta fold hydrolase [Enterococcus saccharolyticus]|uniref:AB hydrolase-1 domain-containing protein n=1 Tax=Candidatus Enterococcus willemsii TaxID=1857215 RepID=A0ABQ6YY85_9ENTE|nr:MULTISPECIES: alpha/beta fold hydrolase [Enterococcus]KAF1302453.1 hypothetical protein BAU17_09380 [Enterococcus sp. CU12B]MCD5002638.1 alpha/beta fold hydrolase [Enterococcus saccharolyticus]